jgi:hypothetical protein
MKSYRQVIKLHKEYEALLGEACDECLKVQGEINPCLTETDRPPRFAEIFADTLVDLAKIKKDRRGAILVSREYRMFGKTLLEHAQRCNHPCSICSPSVWLKYNSEYPEGDIENTIYRGLETPVPEIFSDLITPKSI